MRIGITSFPTIVSLCARATKDNEEQRAQSRDAGGNDDDAGLVRVPDPEGHGLPGEVGAGIEGRQFAGFDGGADGGEEAQAHFIWKSPKEWGKGG